MGRLADETRETGRRADPWTVLEAVAGCSLLVMATLVGLFLAHHPGLNRVDASGLAHVRPDPGSPLAKDLVQLGSVTALAFGVAAVFIVEVFRDWVRALVCALAPIVAVIVVEQVAKPLVGRHIAVGELTYPSGTVTVTAAVVAAAFIVTPQLLRPLCALAGAAAVAGVSAAVLVLRWHYPTDVFGGICVGFGTVFLFDGLVQLARDRTRRGRAARAA